MVMSKTKTLVMVTALAAVLGAGTACYRLFGGSSEAAKEAEIEECAGLSGQTRVDCEARHKGQ
jgi:hypothetical protein